MKIIILILASSLSLGLLAKINADNFLSFFDEKKKISKKYAEFNKLKFAYEEAHTSCVSSDISTMICRMGTQAQMIFEKKTIGSPKALPLVRLARKEAWHKNYSLINQYVEEDFKNSLGSLRLQKALVYYLDNILWPVLLRAYDVVIDEHTCISITTKCDFRDWPAVEKTIMSIEASFSRISRNS
jgi:hypothetical protein